MRYFLLLCLSAVAFIQPAQAIRALPPTTIDVYTIENCGVCDLVESWLTEGFMPQAYPQVNVAFHDVGTSTTASLELQTRLEAHDITLEGIPMIFIGKHVIKGAEANEILAAIQDTYGEPYMQPTLLGKAPQRTTRPVAQPRRVVTTVPSYRKRTRQAVDHKPGYMSREQFNKVVHQPKKRYWGNRDEDTRREVMTKLQQLNALR